MGDNGGSQEIAGPQLIIRIQPDGSVNVSGPLDNKAMCYMMLECARDAIHDLHLKNAESKRIVPVSGTPRIPPGLMK
jgi:hypothetical protein